MLVAVPPHNTSRACPRCAHVAKDNRLTQTNFLCVECGYENNADVVGAINVLEEGVNRIIYNVLMLLCNITNNRFTKGNYACVLHAHAT